MPFSRMYVDDTFCLLKSEEDVLYFFDFINKQHPSVTFSMEQKADNRPAVFDVLVDSVSLSSPSTSVYLTNSYTGLLPNFFSFSPRSYKVGLVKTLVDKTYTISNTWHGFHKDIEAL